jgi:hypothetical protein
MNPALKTAPSAEAKGACSPGDFRVNPLLRLELELCRRGTCQLETCQLDTCRLASCRPALLQQLVVHEVGPQQRPRPRRQMSQFQRSEISTSEFSVFTRGRPTVTVTAPTTQLTVHQACVREVIFLADVAKTTRCQRSLSRSMLASGCRAGDHETDLGRAVQNTQGITRPVRAIYSRYPSPKVSSIICSSLAIRPKNNVPKPIRPAQPAIQFGNSNA